MKLLLEIDKHHLTITNAMKRLRPFKVMFLTQQLTNVIIT